MRRIKRRALWVLVAFIIVLTYFAGRHLLEKLDERDNARMIGSWVQTSTLFNRLIHELQKERGLSSGLISSGGADFGEALTEQYARTDQVVTWLHEREQDPLPHTEFLAGAVTEALEDLRRLEDLRSAVRERRILRDEAVVAYTELITPFFDQLFAGTRITRAGGILRQQMAFLFFLRAKEMAGQERALLTTMLAAGDYSPVPTAAFHRIKAEERAHHEKFLQLADAPASAAYRDILTAPFVAQAEYVRQMVFAVTASGEGRSGSMMVPLAARWFELASLKLDMLNEFEYVLTDRLLDSAQALQQEAQRELATNALGMVISLALAGMLLAQLWRGKELAEKDLHLAAEVFGNSVESIIISDAGSRIVDVNQAFTRITGYEPEEVLGQHTRMLNSGRHDKAFYTAMWDKLRSTGTWEGEVWNQRKSGEIYPALLSIVAVKNAKNETTHYIAMTVDLTKYKETEAMLEQLRTFDPLTGLPNRAAWHSTVEQAVADARRVGDRFAVVVMGLDRFKVINESLGHGIGDRVLAGAADNVKRLLRRHDVAARPGGDCFAILMTGMHDPRSIAAFCERLLAAFRQPLRAEDKPLHVSVSIGVALFPNDGEDSRSLLRNAESALRSAKEDGRNCYKFYSAEMNAAGVRLLALEQLLRQALDRNELSIAYQPQFDARKGHLVGAEALLRWHSAELGVVSPAQFIPIAEATGLIVPIGKWVLRQACEQARHWGRRHGQGLRVSVNLSARQFLREDLLTTVRQALDTSGLEAQLLELEITEGLLMNDPTGAARILAGLRAIGVRISLDDFGTGYSSLAYLKKFPLDRLKLDRAFVKDVPDDDSDCAISHAVIALGHHLSLEVLAEGVETHAQRDFLAAAGCDFFQGYLFAHPLPADELETLFASPVPAPDSPNETRAS